MDSAAFYAFGFAAAVIVLAILATGLARRSRKRRGGDLNKSGKDGEALATWIGLDSARNGNTPEE